MEVLEGLAPALRWAALHVLRAWALIWMLPMFGSRLTPRIQQFGLALVVGLSAAAARMGSFADPGADPALLAVLAAKEIVFGSMLGWGASLVFDAARIAGSLITTEMGLSLAHQVDPARGGRVGLLSQFFQGLAVIFFFAGGGHLMVMKALLLSFEGVPPGSFPEIEGLGEAIIGFGTATVAAGVRLAAPVLVVLIVVTVCVGLLAKVAPNLHVLEASYPIRILTTLLLLVMFLPAMAKSFDLVFASIGRRLFSLAGGGA